MKTVILGAGVVGVTTAYYLAREGHQVVVPDRQSEMARETSFANAGLVAPGHSCTWASPQAPWILLKSLFLQGQALRLKLRWDPQLWAWGLQSRRGVKGEQGRAYETAFRAKFREGFKSAFNGYGHCTNWPTGSGPSGVTTTGALLPEPSWESACKTCRCR